MRFSKRIALLVVLLMPIGCGTQKDQTSAAATAAKKGKSTATTQGADPFPSGESDASTARRPPLKMDGLPAGNNGKLKSVEAKTPHSAVRQFLEALRSGNNAVAETLLTRKARQETAKSDLALKPPGSDSAEFKIHPVEQYTNEAKDEGYVESTWTERDAQGNVYSNDVTWMLRLEDQHWRVAGMAIQPFPGQPPIALNFEDPTSVVRAWQEAERQQQQADNQGGASHTASRSPDRAEQR